MERTGITRRRFLKWSMAASGLGFSIGLYTWRYEPHWIELTERTLPLSNLPGKLAGKCLVQLSDLHIKDGSCAVTPMGDNANRRSSHRLCSRCETESIQPVFLN